MTDTPIATLYLTVAEAAKVLSCSSDSVRRLISRGELRAYRFGRLIRIATADISGAGRPVTRQRARIPAEDALATPPARVTSGRRDDESWKSWADRRGSGA
ncbi:helix-turn-helix domain-containing protein [Pseudactinotalea sp.]|uniref:helix-turn-helix domain-containing protein n=1 Tax=Pseudactinotalea sp. TaxID=1926260 RepID=UPI003B3B4833